MNNIRKVLQVNLKALRGKRTQEEVAGAAGLHIKTYQRLEGGTLPTKLNLSRLAAVLGVQSETELFIDPDFAQKNESLNALRWELVELIASLDESEVRATRGFLHGTLKKPLK